MALAGGVQVLGVVAPSPAESLLGDLVRAVATADADALERGVDLLLRHPCIDYARLEAAPAAASRPLVIERGLAPRDGREGAAVATLPAGGEGGSLRVASRTSPLGGAALAWCEAAAGVLTSALERRRLEDELLHSQRALLASELATAVVHDVNNVLTGIVGFTSLLSTELPPGHPAHRHLEMVETLSASGHDLTRQLLRFGRRDGGAVEAVDVNAVARDVLVLTSTRTGERINVTLDADETLPPVRAERALLGQALTNLVVNAADAMPDGGHVVVRTRVRAGADGGRRVTVEVVDDGPGIPADLLPHLFTAFFTTKEPGSGTGLGLTSVRRIVERYGGAVEVFSRPGGGATFTLLLPAATA